jgi:hypothetical protein
MSEYEHDKIVPYAASNAAKKEQVATMFDHIAKRYELIINIFISGNEYTFKKLRPRCRLNKLKASSKFFSNLENKTIGAHYSSDRALIKNDIKFANSTN